MRIVRTLGWIALAAAAMAACTSTPGTGGTGGGCPNDLPASCPPGAAEYAATIAPLISSKCMPCHAPGGEGGRELDTYATVSGVKSTVLTQVYGCRMPPAGATPLTEAEREELLGWLVCGAPNN